ncbi:MAG: hypothetical protein FWC65_00445 [Treponema sp.]|nr:hypothetical protein [Treponema sp.]
MKKFKKHIAAIIIIITMQVFSLATSPAYHTEVAIHNNTSQNLRFRVTRYDRHDIDSYVEEFSLLRGDRRRLNTIFTGRTRGFPEEFITSIIILGENNEKIIEYKINKYNISEIFFEYLRERRGFLGGTMFFRLRITDEMLELIPKVP